MNLEFQEYNARKIVNTHKHVDSWFWNKYSASPYVGCRSGCEFCYLRGNRYLSQHDPQNFDALIRVKINAIELLHKEMSILEPDVIACGDWQQPAEDRYQLSRRMLEVVYELAHPLVIIERSPLLTRDLDILIEINQKSWVGVIFSISNIDPVLKQAFEPRSPGIKRRLEAMATIANSGILVGTALIPIIPFFGDNQSHLEDVIISTKDHGGTFVLAGGLTMDGIQADRTLDAALKLDHTTEVDWHRHYNWNEGGEPEYSPPKAYMARLGLLVRDLCTKHGVKDRMPRYIPKNSLASNKRIAEKLFLKTYDLELEQEKDYRIWAYRKGAWVIDEWPENIAELYYAHGESGIRKLPGIGKSLASKIAGWLGESEN